MNIEASTVRKLKITDVKGLDHVSVFLEDFEPRKGKITIEVCGKSWSSCWGGMGGQTISEFFRSCDNGYLARNLQQGIRSEIETTDDIQDHLKSRVIESRREYDFDADEARELFDRIESMYVGDTLESLDYGLMSEILGDDWWCDVPKQKNPEYEYLCRIIDNVKEALEVIDSDKCMAA